MIRVCFHICGYRTLPGLVRIRTTRQQKSAHMFLPIRCLSQLSGGLPSWPFEACEQFTYGALLLTTMDEGLVEDRRATPEKAEPRIADKQRSGAIGTPPVPDVPVPLVVLGMHMVPQRREVAGWVERA